MTVQNQSSPSEGGTPPGRQIFRPDNVRALGWLMSSVVAASAMTLCIRWLADAAIDSRMIVLLRFGLTALGLLALIALVPRLRRQTQFSLPVRHLNRGLTMGASAQLGFYAMANMNLVTATVLFFTAPIFATLLAVVLQGERPGPRRIAAIGAGFLGVLVVLRPTEAAFSPEMLAALASSGLFGLALTQSRRVAEADGSFSVLTSSVVVTALMAIPLAWPVFALPSSTLGWAVTGLIVVSGGVRVFADIHAYRIGEAAVLAPFAYLRLVLIGVGAYVLFGETPDRTALIGAAIIMSAAIYIARREQMAKRAAASKADPSLP